MALKVLSYDDFTETYAAHSENGTLTNPVRFLANPKETAVAHRHLYLRNDSPSYYYTGITLQLLPTTTTVDELAGLVFKLYASTSQPTEAQWQPILSGNTLSMPDVGTVDLADQSYYSFWVRIESPRSISLQTLQGDDLYLNLTFTELPVVG
jgi:hypothetical protein